MFVRVGAGQIGAESRYLNAGVSIEYGTAPCECANSRTWADYDDVLYSFLTERKTSWLGQQRKRKNRNLISFPISLEPSTHLLARRILLDPARRGTLRKSLSMHGGLVSHYRHLNMVLPALSDLPRTSQTKLFLV